MLSCKMITYGRVEYLEESLQSFLNQDYDGEKELVIINDYPEQKLIFDHPDVRIFNLDYTFPTIGDKENFAVSQCKGDTIIVWDDDDLALPNHLKNIDKYFVEGTALMHWQRGIFYNVPDIQSITSLGNSGIVYSREAWEGVGKHPLENAGYDMTFVISIKEKFPEKIVLASPPDDEVSWFYVWGGRGYHMSGMGSDNDDSKPSVIVRHFDHIESLRVQGKIPTGDVYLNPNWKYDYSQLLKNFIKKPIVDFIIPTYNRINELKSILYSLLAQTNTDWVANVIIDNSVDEFNQIDIVKDDRIKYTLLDKTYNDWGHTPREIGKQNSIANYIVMTGDDNYYTPNFVEELSKASEFNPAIIYWDMVHSHYEYHFFECSLAFNQIDIGAFAVRNDVGKNIILGKEYAADGYFVEKVMQAYQDYVKIDKVLYVHN